MGPLYISDYEVSKLLGYETVFEAVSIALKSVVNQTAKQNARGITVIPNSDNRMYTMPGYLESNGEGILMCKLVTDFPKNNEQGVSSIMANIMLMNHRTGELKAIVAATELTLWRTAAASAVATKYLHANKNKNVLAIIGSGSQGKTHALAFQHYFSFNEVRVWNRTIEKAQKLVKELLQVNGHKCVVYDNIEDCVKDADVIVTATASDRPLIHYKWIKKGVHINVVGVNGDNFELDDETYKFSEVYIDSWEGAKNELTALKVDFKGQIGDVITGAIPPPSADSTTVFQSLGMAVEDCAVAGLIYDLYTKQNCK